ncbi:hypothetical protein OF83DRAFT_1153168, partial [Amylostereum chailletii]
NGNGREHGARGLSSTLSVIPIPTPRPHAPLRWPGVEMGPPRSCVGASVGGRTCC